MKSNITRRWHTLPATICSKCRSVFKSSLWTQKTFRSIMALACVGAVFYLAGNILIDKGLLLPKWITWESGTYYANPVPYQIILNHKAVNIFYDNAPIWTSPDDIKVQQVLSCDIDRDAEEELVLLCWKKGRFGSYKPFWVEEDEACWSQHIFVYEYDDGKVTPKWMSSYLGQNVARMDAIESLNANNGYHASQNILMLNSEQPLLQVGRLFLTDTDGLITRWVWDSWGFKKEDTDVSFAVFGDNLIHEAIYRYGLYHGESFDFLFENVRELINGCDISVINQETPLTDNPSLYSDYPRFGTPVSVGAALADAGFDVVTCATNHALDQGAHGVQTTKEFFDSHNILCLGIQAKCGSSHTLKDTPAFHQEDRRPYEIIEKNGIRFALFNYTYGTNGIRIPEENPYMVHLLDDEDEIRDDIQKARNEADFIIVFAHWGTENSQQTDPFQQKWAQIFLDSKVDVVIGTHPHTLQPYEMLTDDSCHEMLVFYSIGNFVSAQPEKACVKGGVASFTVSLTSTGYKVTEYALQPLIIVREDDGMYTVKPKSQ
ncbi:CapA family protein [Parablautia muri]|uniref:CapA family protein n=1 Tax=Parablautia muri TaxID=2320879 RepID=A0A9X5BH79_9FIRM|nr:CapA family protein [Parablautia muri]NBJ93994.1 CapA family protein [Parablautia muri]